MTCCPELLQAEAAQVRGHLSSTRQQVCINVLILFSHSSHVQLFATLWTVAHQAPLSMGFSRQEYWSGLPFPSPGDLPHPVIEPVSPALAGRFFTSWEAPSMSSHPLYCEEFSLPLHFLLRWQSQKYALWLPGWPSFQGGLNWIELIECSGLCRESQLWTSRGAERGNSYHPMISLKGVGPTAKVPWTTPVSAGLSVLVPLLPLAMHSEACL